MKKNQTVLFLVIFLGVFIVSYSGQAKPPWEIDGDPSDFPQAGSASFSPVDAPSVAGKFTKMLLRKTGSKIQGAIFIDASYKPYDPKSRWDIRFQIEDTHNKRVDASFSVNPFHDDQLDIKAGYYNGTPHTRLKDLDTQEFNCVCDTKGCEFEIPVPQLEPGQLNVSVVKRVVNKGGASRIAGYIEEWDPKLLKPGNKPRVFDGLPYDFPLPGSAVTKKAGSESLAGKWEKMALRIEKGFLVGAAFHDITHLRYPDFSKVYIIIRDDHENALKYSFDNSSIDYAKRQAAPSKRWTDYTLEGAENICTRHGCEFKFPLKDLKRGKVTIEYIRRGYVNDEDKQETKITGQIRY